MFQASVLFIDKHKSYFLPDLVSVIGEISRGKGRRPMPVDIFALFGWVPKTYSV